MKVLFTFIIVVFSIGQLRSQNPEGSDFQNSVSDFQIKTPGLSDFIKYGNLSNISYTGEFSTSIPLIQANIHNQNPINLNLVYTGSGFKPSKRNGLVGQNWHLSGLGVITRQINGMPDEQLGAPEVNGGNSGNYTNGFLAGVRQRFPGFAPSNAQAFDPESGFSYPSFNFERYVYAFPQQGLNPNNYEAESDIYFFNVNGISGKFFISFDGSIKVSSNNQTKLFVDMNGVNLIRETTTSDKPQALNSNINPYYSEIIISDDKGNKYYFGGTTSKLEYSINLNVVGTTDTSSERPVINAWYLSKVKYYNGQEVEYIYRDDSGLPDNFGDSSIQNHGSDDYPKEYVGYQDNLKDFVQVSEFFSKNATLQSFSSTNWPVSGGSISGSSSYSLGAQIQKIAILERIKGSDFKIDFSYSRQNRKFNEREPNPNIPTNNSMFFSDHKGGFIDIKLDNISYVKTNGGGAGVLINDYIFNYEEKGGTYNRLFLTSLTDGYDFFDSNKNNFKEYVFEYYNACCLPFPISRGVDHWGYDNGRNSYTNQMTPTVTLQANGDQILTGNERDPATSNFEKGLLKKIFYPTGGYTEIKYEKHNYSKRLEARSQHGFIPQLYNVNGNVGGARLQSIKDVDENGESNYKEYKYLKNYLTSGQGGSSGILLKWPRYVLAYQVGDNDFAQKFGYIRSDPIGKYINENLIMTYSEVAEVTNGIGYKRVKFTNFQSNGDHGTWNDIQGYSIENNPFYKWRGASSAFNKDNVKPAGLCKNYYKFLLNDRSIERGKPMWEGYYDDNNLLKKETFYEYNTSPNRFDSFTTAFHLSGLFVQFNKMYYYSDFLTKKIDKNYFDNGVIETVTNNSYLDDLKKMSNSSIITSDNNIITNNYNYNELTNPNQILLTDKETLYNGSITQKKIYNYGSTTDAETNFKRLIKEVKSFRGSTSTNLNTNISVIHKYDDNDNVIELSQNNGIRTCYIWGYNKTLLIAKIENCTYSEIEPYVGNLQILSNNDSPSVGQANLLNAFSAFRLAPALQNKLITTYTHKSGVGVSSITDTSGNTSYFEYDKLERLISVKDRNGFKMLKHEYNYQQKNQF